MILSVLFLLLIQHFNFISSESLNDIALKFPTGSWIINSSLIDSETNDKYTFNEIIYSGQYIEGKISISFETLKWDVYYSTINRNQRLVIHDGKCDLITYNTKWESKLSGIKSPLLNHILLVGPSVIHRLAQNSLSWEQGSDTEMRGVTMHSKSTSIGGKSLKITNYYMKDNAEPSVTVFTGNDPSEPDWSKETLTLHTYIRMEKSVKSTQGLVKPEPGIGCPFYFARITSKPQLFSQSFSLLHYSVDTTEKSIRSKKITKKEEVYIDAVTQQMYIETTIDGKKSEEIYDFTLGIKYQDKEYNSCPIKQLDLTFPGIVVDQDQGRIDINAHLGFNLNYKFVGIVQNNLTSGRDLYVWEAVEYNKTLNGQKYFKLVTTQYLLLTSYEDVGEQFVPHSTTINGYMDTNFIHMNILEIRRIFRKFEPEIKSEDYDSKFNVDKCYPFESYHRTISLNFKCQGDCDHFKSQIYQLRYAIKSMIIKTKQISASRISEIEVIPDSNGQIAYITFLQAPEMKDVFSSDTNYQQSSSLVTGSSIFKAESKTECIALASKSGQNYPTIVYCYESDECYAFKTQKELLGSRDGKFCNVYQIPLKNLRRFGQELPLNKIDSGIEWKNLNFKLSDSSKTALYSCDHMENVASKAERNFDLSYLDYDRRRLIPNDENIIKIEGVKSVSECFHECLHTDKFDCRSISVCAEVDQLECMISNLSRIALIDDDIAINSSCKILFRNSILDYVKVSNRKYKNAPTIPRLGFYSENCASLCYETNDCLSFQDCNRDCTFGGYYTDSTTEFSQDCNIYIPKVLHKFIDNGKRIVSDVLHTEFGLTLDQCAALCHEWQNLDEVCQSFNYCPSTATTSSCELSKYMIDDSSTKTTESKICHNYGFKTLDAVKSRSSKVVHNEGRSTKTVIGFITIFVAIGFVVGFGLPFVYAKFRPPNNSNFRLNEQ